MLPHHTRSATFILAATGLVLNAFAAAHLFRLWNSLRWERESEWEGSEKYMVDGVRLVWCLLSAYFSVATAACAVGLVGVVKRAPAFIRLFRAYSLADLCVCSTSVVVFALASFRPAVRAVVCEELSRRADLMRDLSEAGLNVENCESWIERAVVVAVGIMSILIVLRLQFTLTISNYYTQLLHSTYGLRLHVLDPSHPPTALSNDSPRPQRIYLLPNRQDHSQQPSPAVVYAPVPLNSISAEDARELDATEAWFASSSASQRHHRFRPRESPLPAYSDNKGH